MNKNFKNLLFALIIITLTFGLLEGGSRLLQQFKEKQLNIPGQEALSFEVDNLSPYVLFRPLPSLELRPNEKIFFKFDGIKVNAEKPPNEFRIFIMGGSVAVGYGASIPKIKFYRILENLLNENQPEQASTNFKVISAGRLGYVSAQELILLLMGILDFHPNMVIHINGANDIIAVAQRQEGPGYPFYFQNLTRAIKATTIEKETYKTLMKSTFLTELNKMFKKYKTSSSNITSMNIARHYERNMKQAAQILHVNNIKTFFALQPILLYKKNKSSKELSIVEKKTAQTIQFWESTYPKLAESLKLISDEEKTQWQDFRKVFDEIGETIFIDSVHFNDLGQEVLAQVLFQRIKNIAYNSTNNG